MGKKEQCRQEDGEPPERRREGWVSRSWIVVRGVLTATSVVASAGQHETLAAGARVLVVVGDTTVKICQDRNRR